MTVVIHRTTEIEEPQITFSATAIKHLLSYLANSSEHKGVRLSVKKTGCSGYSYVVDYVDAVKEQDLEIILAEGYKAYVDRASYPLLKGMNVDYVKQGLNSKFVFNNPNQTGQCGCGESFTADSEFK